jgi:hypothetical protein
MHALRKALVETITREAGITLATNLLYRIIIESILQAFVKLKLNSPLAATMSKAEQIKLSLQPRFTGLGLRPGFTQFCERNVSRLLQFAHLRVCDCDQRAAEPYAPHAHGLKMYYHKGQAHTGGPQT